jgi:hypothetical protein
MSAFTNHLINFLRWQKSDLILIPLRRGQDLMIDTETLSKNGFKGDFGKSFDVKVEVEKEIRNIALCHDLS